MSDAKRFKALCLCAAACVAALVMTTCEIRLRGDDDQALSLTSLAQQSDPMTSKLEQCRAVKHDERDAILKCQRLWAEKRREFLGDVSGPSLGAESGRPATGSLPPVSRKDESRLPSTYVAIPAQSE